VDIEDRDEAWEGEFLQALPQAQVHVLRPEPQEGPDNWPYLLISTEEGADDPITNVIGWLCSRGIGLVINPQKPIPDFVLSYGMLWNFRERGEFLSSAHPQNESNEKPQSRSERFEIKPGQQLYAGPPSESYLPKYVRTVLKQFLADQGVFSPKVLMISEDQKNFDLCFSIESLKSPPAHEHKNIAEALSWFLPPHYTLSLVSEKMVSGFQPL
jgi:hypothetical protein